MVVLVNGGSASASEIVAARAARPQARDGGGHADIRQGLGADDPAAGQQYRDQTDHRPLLHPSGRSIQAKGHRARRRCRRSHGANHGRLREADLEKHLLNDQEGEGQSEKPADQRKPSTDAEEKPPAAPLEFASEKDFQFQQALKFLKGLPLATAQSAPPRPRRIDKAIRRTQKSAPPYLRGMEPTRSAVHPADDFPLTLNDDQLLRYSRHHSATRDRRRGAGKAAGFFRAGHRRWRAGLARCAVSRGGRRRTITLADGDAVDLTNLRARSFTPPNR